ncbi:MAG: LysE family translocator, partial [Cyclobacteriaceae bacterium]
MHLEVYLSFVFAATILIIIPGPTLLTIVSHTIRYGTKRATHSILGASLAHLLFVIIVAFGINKLLLLSIEYFLIIKWIGVLYLLFLGLRQFFVTPKSQMLSLPKKGQSSLFLQGFFVTITNPKSIL